MSIQASPRRSKFDGLFAIIVALFGFWMVSTAVIKAINTPHKEVRMHLVPLAEATDKCGGIAPTRQNFREFDGEQMRTAHMYVCFDGRQFPAFQYDS